MSGASVVTIASFPTSTGNGTDPDGQLFMDSNGDLLGATVHGGANGIGTTYEIAKVAGGFATTPTFLADLPAGLNTLLGVPNLSADANGDLFGMEITGGTNHLGTVVEFPAGGGAPITVANFTGGAAGSGPGGRLLVDASGNLFGITLSGGSDKSGTLFEVQKTASGYAATPTVLTSFVGMAPFGASNLVEDAAGDLFGTTTSNTVFEVKNTGAGYAPPAFLVRAASFPTGTQQLGNLTIDSKGDIFGTTVGGGANGDGTVFEIEKTPTGYASTTILASFSLADGQLSLNRPKTLIVDANGDLFGTTDPSSQNTGGVVFEIVKTGNSYNPTPTIVVNFGTVGESGLGANLVADANGDLFGTTQTGGANGSGTVFEITDGGFVAPIVPVVHPNNLASVVHPNNLALSGSVTGALNFIDTLNFVASYGDLINAFGTNQQTAQNWYNTREPIEQRPETFDGLDYIASYGDLINAFKSAGSEQAVLDAGATHFINNGFKEGRTTTFNGLDYIASYGDLINAFGANGDAGATHYIDNGHNEGRTTTFDGLDYIASYGDLIKAFGANEQAGAEHFIDNGFKEGRKTTFDGLDYIANYTDLMKAFGANNDAGATHYIDYGLSEGRSTTFNVGAYESAHPDLIGKFSSDDAFLTAYINTYKASGTFLT